MNLKDLKFRVWHKKLKRWGTVYHLVMSEKKGLFAVVADFGKGIEEQQFADDVIVEQFTGFRDRTGRDIFEGDIVQSDYGYGSPGPDIVSLAGIFCARCECTVSENIDIVGNIHENPKLAEEV